jgi:hypothetical protein
MAWSHGKFFWNELRTRDVAGTKKFYADTMGWSFETMPGADGSTYLVAMMNREPVGGVFDITGAEFKDVPAGWMSYIAVDDIDARVKKAVTAGAKVMRPIFEVPGVGRIAILIEPSGTGIGWMTPAN